MRADKVTRYDCAICGDNPAEHDVEKCLKIKEERSVSVDPEKYLLLRQERGYYVLV